MKSWARFFLFVFFFLLKRRNHSEEHARVNTQNEAQFCSLEWEANRRLAKNRNRLAQERNGFAPEVRMHKGLAETM